MNKICRVCLSTKKTLTELDDNLLDHFNDICDYSTGFSKHLCCSTCKDSLENNLDFKNKCLESNKILQNWKKNKRQTKAPIDTLQEILLESLKHIKKEITEENVSRPKYECYTKDYKIHRNINNHVNENDNKDFEAKIMKDEADDDLFEVIDCGNEVDKNCNDGEGMLNDENGVHENSLSDNDDDMLLIDCITESIKSKKLETEDKSNFNAVPEKRVYQRKGLSAYLQYQVVFDIQLFKNDEEARREVLQRQTSEPYLSAPHRCSVCYTVYKCDKLLRFHMKWHDTVNEFVCDICGMRFPARKALQCHKAKCHRGKFTCKLCPLITYYGGAMKAHFQKHQGKLFKCHCDRVFKHISSYLTHKRTVHSSSHVCVTCARTFVSELGLISHRTKTHQTKSKVDSGATAHCTPCGLTFANQHVYTVHILNTDTHKDVAKDMTACSYCGLSFDDETQLKTHKREQHPMKRSSDIFKCKLCGAEGAGRTWRRRHYGAEHPRVRYLDVISEARVHMCDQCGKRFSNITLMKAHMNAHLGLKPYACGRCRDTFSSANERTKHARTHGVRRLTCDACDKTFLHRATLRQHVRGVHQYVRRTGHKPQH